MSKYFEFSTYEETAAYLTSKLLPHMNTVKLGIVCGSGLGGLVECFDSPPAELDYKSIPHFKASTVPGHVGKLVFGKMSNIPTVCMLGRMHLYEGHDVVETVYPIRIMKLLGVTHLIVTNASGGLATRFNVGDFMIIKDHVSFAGMAGQNPLIGKNIPEFGPRFPPISAAYNFELRCIAAQAGKELGIEGLQEGVYSYLTGPSFETRAEARFLRDGLHADCVGMSTVPEVVAACHAGMKVLGLSMITNKVSVDYGRSALAYVNGEGQEAGDENKVASHEEVLETSQVRSRIFTKYVRRIVELIAKDISE